MNTGSAYSLPRTGSAAGRELGRFAMTPLTQFQIMAIPLRPLPASGARARATAAGAAGLRDDNLGKRTIAVARESGLGRGKPLTKERGRPGAARCSGPAMFAPLMARSPLPPALHHNSCHTETNGSPTRERKQRNPHGDPLRLLLTRLSSAQITPQPPIRSGNLWYNNTFSR